MNELQLGSMTVEVVLKDIKHIHLSVYPPEGKVRVAAPLHMTLDTIRVYAVSKLDWIKRQQEKFRRQQRQTPQEFINRESHYFLGRRYLLKVMEIDASPRVLLKHKTMTLQVRPGADLAKRREVLDEWYRARLEEILPPMIKAWEQRLEVEVAEFGIKKMKTKWGSCQRDAKRIWLNLDLAKKPPECLEYVVAHEIAHLLERRHSLRFVALLDAWLPKWRLVKEELNRLPVAYEIWK